MPPASAATSWRLTTVDLLVLEDFGMKRLGPTAAEDLLEIFVRRHETASTVITTNRPTQDWGQFLGDVPATTTILDRFLAHADIIQMRGKSYRLHQRVSQGTGNTDGPKASRRGDA
jgi:DNA replication protein DnaC